MYNVGYYFQWATMLISCSTGLLALFYSKRKEELKYFYLYPIVAVIFCSFSIIKIETGKISTIQEIYLNKISFIFHFGFLSFFILKNTIPKSQIKLPLLIAGLGFSVILFFVFFPTYKLGQLIFVISNLSLFFLSSFYFINLYKNITEERLIGDPIFWILSGIFISMGLSIPNNLISHFILINYGDSLNNIAKLFGAFAYGLMHLFFSKAFLCTFSKR